jgi:hypothetical protein
MNLQVRNLLLAISVCLAGCTNEQLYNSTAGWRAQDCERLEVRDRAECLKNARASYSEYKKAKTEAEPPDGQKADERP